MEFVPERECKQYSLHHVHLTLTVIRETVSLLTARAPAMLCSPLPFGRCSVTILGLPETANAGGYRRCQHFWLIPVAGVGLVWVRPHPPRGPSEHHPAILTFRSITP